MHATTDYAIRVMIYLAKVDRIASSTEIAEHTSISQKYLIKLAAVLRDAGFIVSQHGYNGGYALAKPAGEITMWEILQCITPESYRFIPSANEVPTDDSALVAQMFCDINTKMQAHFASVTLLNFIRKKPE